MKVLELMQNRYSVRKFDAKKVSESAKSFSKDNFKKNFEREIRKGFNEKF